MFYTNGIADLLQDGIKMQSIAAKSEWIILLTARRCIDLAVAPTLVQNAYLSNEMMMMTLNQ